MFWWHALLSLCIISDRLGICFPSKLYSFCLNCILSLSSVLSFNPYWYIVVNFKNHCFLFPVQNSKATIYSPSLPTYQWFELYIQSLQRHLENDWKACTRSRIYLTFEKFLCLLNLTFSFRVGSLIYSKCQI